MKKPQLWLVTTLVMAGATLLVIIVGTTLMKRADSHTFTELFKKQNEKEIAIMVGATREAIISEDVPLLESVISDHFLVNENLLLFRVFNEDGISLVNWSKGKNEQDPYILKRNVKLENEKFGRIEVGWRSDWITSQVESYAGRLRFFLIAILVVLAGLIILLVHLFVVRPVRDIDRRLRGVVEPNQDSTNIRMNSRELDHLSESVNQLRSLIVQKEAATRELVQSESFKAAVLSSSHDGIVTIDEHNRIVEFNPAAEEMFGFSREEAIGQEIIELFVPQKLRKIYARKFDSILVRTMRHELGTNVVLNAWNRAGDVIPVEIGISPFNLENRTYFTASIKDITERKKTEIEMRRSRDEAEKANEAKSRFLATMSHEIRTPLNALININEILLNTTLNSAQIKLVKTGYNSGKVLSDIVDVILDFSQIESGNLQLDNREFTTTSTILMVTDILETTAKDKGLDFSISINSSIPTQLVGDAIRIRQVLFNLIGNAIKFTDSGQVSVEISLEGSPTNSGTVYLRSDIKDTGIGIDENEIDSLFTEFTRGGAHRTGDEHSGTGLGLAICKKLVGLMGGEITAESTIDEGSHFWFVIPLKQYKNAEIESQLVKSITTNNCVQIDHNKKLVSNMQVLVVEDSETNQLIISSLLDGAGINCTIVNSGSNALNTLSSEKFELILMDVGLPDIDGIEVTKRIRASNFPSAKTPIIALTAYAFTEDKEKCLEAGMNDYVRKPIDREELLAAVFKHHPLQ